MTRTVRRTIFAVLVLFVAALAFVNAASSGGVSTARSKLTIIAPAAPGGGWDGFSREAQQALRTGGTVTNPQVVNIPGAGGTIGLSQFVQEEGREDLIMTTGGVMVGAIELGTKSETLDDVVPLARMADDYSVLVVPADSEFQTLDDFVEAWLKDPGATSISGGSLGSIDHFLGGLIAMELGEPASKVNYVAYSGGGEALNSLLAHTTSAGISGYNEVKDQIEAGNLRALAISSEERLEGSDVPTFKEQGLDVSMSNWRGFVAPPGISEETKQELLAIIDELHSDPAWQEAVRRNSWVDTYQTGEEFEDFLAEEIETAELLVKELGL